MATMRFNTTKRRLHRIRGAIMAIPSKLNKPRTIKVWSFMGQHECRSIPEAVKVIQMLVNANKARKAAAS